MIRLEKSLDACLEQLKVRCSSIHVDVDISDADDLDSLASGSTNMNAMSLRRSTVRFSGQLAEVGKLNKKVKQLETENRDLRKRLKELECAVRSDADQAEEFADENKKVDSNVQNMSEARVWNILRNRGRGKTG